jgi:hypothetical protein
MNTIQCINRDIDGIYKNRVVAIWKIKIYI